MGSCSVDLHIRHIEHPPPLHRMGSYPLTGVLLYRLAHQALKGASWVDASFQRRSILLCCLVHQARRGAPLTGSFSVVQCVRRLAGQPVYCSAMLECGEREAMVMTPPPTLDSAVSPCFHGCLAFLHRHFPPPSPPSHPLHPSLHSQWQPSPWGCSTISQLQLPGTGPSRRPTFLPRVCVAAARTVCFSFHLVRHRSAVSLSDLKVSPLTQTTALIRGSDPCFSSLTHQGQVQSYQHSCFSPWFLHPTKFCLGLYILLRWSGPPVGSQLVFCMHFRV